MAVSVPSSEAGAGPPRPRSGAVREALIGYLLVAPPLLFLAVTIIYPALHAVLDTVAPEQVVLHHGVQSVERVPSLQIYQQLFSGVDYRVDRRAIVYTLQVTAISLVALFAVCYPLAMYLRFGKGRLPAFFRTLTLIPLFIPTIISAFAFISFYQQGNFLDVLLRDTRVESTLFGGRFPLLIDNTSGIVLAQIWNSIPLTVLLIGAGLGEIDDALIESARDVGAGTLRIFRSILFPLSLRQALIALVLNTIGILGSYTIPTLVGPTSPQMLGPAMNDNVAVRRLPVAQAEAVITFLFAAAIGMLYVIALVRQRRR